MAPALLNAAIEGLGNSIGLFFDGVLDASKAPAPAAITVQQAGRATPIAVDSIVVFNNQLRLRLAEVLAPDAVISISCVSPPEGFCTAFSNQLISTRLSLLPSETERFAQAGTLAISGGAEISAFDAGSKRLFVTSAAGLQVLSVDGDLKLTFLGTLSLGSNDITSVAVRNGLVAVAVNASVKTDPGQVVFLDADAALNVSGTVIAPDGLVLGTVAVGALPDMVTFTPDGTKVLVANEGEQTDVDGSNPPPLVNPEGSVSIIDLANGVANASVSTATFTAFNAQAAALKAAGVRLFAGETGFAAITVAQDLEPEYIAVSPDGKTAFVTLQENNALAILDLSTGQFTDIVPLGLKSFLGLPFDGTDRDGPSSTTLTNLRTDRPVFGQYMPDAVASFLGADGDTYYLLANEGDDRNDFIAPNEAVTLSTLTLDSTIFPNAAVLKTDPELGRLTVSAAPGINGDTDRDGDIDQILGYGARSFAIVNAEGTIVFDSGSHIEQFAAANSGVFDDTRSDNKGPEPEGVTVGRVGGKTLAFVGLERGGGGVMVYDVSDPLKVSFVQYLRNPADKEPEGLLFVPAKDSPSGQDALFVTNEDTKTVTAFENTAFSLQLLHLADAEAGVLASRTAPYLAALVDGFDHTHANTLILAGGDNFIPSPFLNGGTDISVRDELNAVTGSTMSLVDSSTTNHPIAAVDIAIHNLIGVEASTIGNHEFDLGTRVFRDAFMPGSVTGWVGAQFPYLSANLDFSGDTNLSGRFVNTLSTPGLEEASAQKGRIVPSAVVTKNGEKIGLVGATTQVLEAISSTGGVEVKGFTGDGGEKDDMALLASQLQPVIDDLIAQGVNKVILMAHLQQIANEKALAPLLSGVDIILAGGSNTRLGDANDQANAFPGHAASFADTYPLLTKDKDGGTTLIVNTDNEYTYLGRLVVDFDPQGRIIPSSIDPLVSGAYAATAATVARVWNVSEAQLGSTAFAEGTKAENVQDLTEAVQAVINSKDSQVWGFSSVYLEGERGLVRNQETNFGNLTADANLAYARSIDPTVVVSLKNGGGIRSQIGTIDVVSGAKEPTEANADYGKPAGGVSTLDIENSLRFNNSLSLVTVSATKLRELLEHGVAVLDNGRFPQVSGVGFSVDLSKPAGSRIVNLAIQDSQGNDLDVVVRNGALVGDAARSFRMVTLNFLAGGGDSYPFPDDAKANVAGPSNRVDLFNASAPRTGAATFAGNGTEQDVLAEYLKANFATAASAFSQADVPAAQDLRLQNLALRSDTVIDPVRLGSALSDLVVPNDPASLPGVDGRLDSLFTGAGDDEVDVGAASGYQNRIFTGSGADVIYASTRDVVTGGSGDDWFSAEAGDGNRLSGGLGDDTFFIGSAANRVLGGAGADKIYIQQGAGSNYLNGGAGPDQFWLIDAPGELPAAKQFVMDFKPGEDKVGLAGVSFASLSFSQVGPDTLLKFGAVELGHFAGISASTLANPLNFA